MICRTDKLGALAPYRYVVVLSRLNGKILLSRHRERATWETQGGHIEPGETPMQAARRELYEESGAADYDIRPLFDYWAGDERTGWGASGVVYAAEIRALGALPESEMAETRAFDALPENLTYPAITPVLFAREREERGMLQVLIGTTNPSKVLFFETLLEGLPVRCVTLRDLDVDREPEECGRTPEENAVIKARFYGRYAPAVICADSGLYFDALELDDPRQPGLHVRTPGGCARLDDEQMRAYYAALVHELGGRAVAYYLDGCAVHCAGGDFGFQATREEARESAFVMLDHPCCDAPPREGWPLDSLSQDMEGVGFLEPNRGCIPQMKLAYRERLRGFLIAKLGL